MSALSIQVPFPVFQDRDGQPLDNGYVWIGTANLNPQTNPVVAYYDSALTIPAVQPLRTLNGYISNAGTPAQVYVDAVSFSILVQDSKGSMVYNFSDGTGISPNAAGIVYDPLTGPATTVQAALRGLVIGTTVQAWDAELDTWSTKIAPTGEVVGTSDTQTLTNKTLTSATLTNATLTTPNINSAQFATVTGTAPLYAARAWVNFNAGSGTVSINGSGNVSSVIRNSVGDYSINFTTNMPDGNYAVALSCRSVLGGTTRTVFINNAVSPTAGVLRILGYDGTSSLVDLDLISAIVFR